jgi:predicted lipoprotein with Yx(FWY)xxD motif
MIQYSWRHLAAASTLALLAACSSPHRQQAMAPQQGTTPHYVFMRSNTGAGQVISTTSGMTLYTYAKDPAGQSTCYGECAQNWPPYLANGTYKPFGKMTLVTRTDGQMQWAYDGHPLYTYVGDTAPGEIKGNDFHNNWHVVLVPSA